MRYRMVFFLVIILASVLRFYSVSTRPHDLYVDEVAIGWNAYSILKTGHDEYGKFMPLSFRSYDDFKLPGYIYATSISEYFFGKTAFAVRLPSVISGIGSVVIVILLVAFLTKSQFVSLTCGLLLAISPWHLQFSRAGFEANMALFFILTGAYLLVIFFRTQRFTLLPGLCCFALALYTYHSPRIFVPILLIAMWVLFRKELLQMRKKVSAWLSISVFFLLLVPYGIYATSSNGMARATSQLFTREVHAQPNNYFENPTFLDINQYAKNYLDYFSLDFLFFWGDQIGRHSVREIGMNYVWQLPFFLYGIVIALKKRTLADRFFFIWYCASPIAAAFTVPNPHALRGLSPVIAVTYFTALGIYVMYKKLIHTRMVSIYILACMSVLVYFQISYLHIYYVHYPQRTDPDWSGGYKQAIDYAIAHEHTYDHIYITKDMLLGYEYLYFYGNFDPSEVQQHPKRKEGIGKYIFLETKTYNQALPPKTLYIGPDYEVRKNDTKLLDINDHGDDTWFRIWEN